jgi:hypothetical protein
MIIVPLESSFGNRSQEEQRGMVSDLQRQARSAGLAGTVVPIWQTSSGGTKFIAPKPWHPFFQSMSFQDVLANLNKTLSW